jgi:hypothetical protein
MLVFVPSLKFAKIAINIFGKTSLRSVKKILVLGLIAIFLIMYNFLSICNVLGEDKSNTQPHDISGPFAPDATATNMRQPMISNASFCSCSDVQIIGIVRNGQFFPLGNQFDLQIPVRLTSISMMEARSPESGELNLTECEGAVIMICGQGSGGNWIYSARVIDRAGPILTAIALNVFENEKEKIAQIYPHYPYYQ